jgi:hypothetical protein
MNELYWWELCETLDVDKIQYKLNQDGRWHAFLDGEQIFIISEGLTPTDLPLPDHSFIKENDIWYFKKQKHYNNDQIEEISWKDYKKLMNVTDFDYKLSPIGLWAGFLNGDLKFYFSKELEPENLDQSNLIIVKCPVYGYYLKQNSNVNFNYLRKIFLGLPNDLIKKVLWVDRKFRTHDWSFIPGGFDIVVVFNNGEILAYDWIKSPLKYVARIIIKREKIEYEAFKEFEVTRKIKLFETHINCIYSRKIEQDKYGSITITDFKKLSNFDNDSLENFKW